MQEVEKTRGAMPRNEGNRIRTRRWYPYRGVKLNEEGGRRRNTYSEGNFRARPAAGYRTTGLQTRPTPQGPAVEGTA
jgi:hypothetical protein